MVHLRNEGSREDDRTVIWESTATRLLAAQLSGGGVTPAHSVRTGGAGSLVHPHGPTESVPLVPRAGGSTRRIGSTDLAKRLGKLTVGEVLHTFRATEALSLKEFGKRIGLSVANLCDIEKGRKGVSPKKAEQIAKALGLPPALLVRLSLEDSLQAARLRYKVEVKPAT